MKEYEVRSARALAAKIKGDTEKGICVVVNGDSFLDIKDELIKELEKLNVPNQMQEGFLLCGTTALN